ncbi:MAG: 23S rRNA (uracil(1939)-C(5))-methyltransferase RlmD [Spirochaetales bacterium]|nr:23S rRNA (uracil(1939)-C(5))-methyltransferase RlmD [Spirochaetales bacterium]
MSAKRYPVGQEIELIIDGYASEGDGVGRSSGAVFFVPGALAGERIKARITEARKNFYRARLTWIEESAPGRRTPPCPLYGECGGCRLQHLSYPEQLVFKERRVRDALERLGGMSPDIVRPIRGMTDPWRYRNKVTFTAGYEKEAPVLGFLRQASRRPVDVPDCLLADEAACDIARAFFRLSRESANGRLTRIVVRHSLASGEYLAVIETKERPLERGKRIAERLMDGRPVLAGVVNAIAPAATGRRVRYAPVAGADTITETLSGIDFTISAGTFFQVNSRQAEALYGRASELVPDGRTARVLDAYCGAGGFALFLARRAESVIGIESDPAAVRDAAENARRNGFANVRFTTGNLEADIGLSPADLRTLTDLVVDPPRRGLGRRFIEECARSSVRRIIYASCDPATLARDCRLLRDKGFTPREVTPFDLFPQTPHVESLALLERM